MLPALIAWIVGGVAVSFTVLRPRSVSIRKAVLCFVFWPVIVIAGIVMAACQLRRW
jgi:hypothetical protein